MGGRVTGWGGWGQNLKQRREVTQRVGFRVAVMYTCTQKGPIFHYKDQTDMEQQWEPYDIPTAKLEPLIGAMTLHIQQLCRKHGWIDIVVLQFIEHIRTT